MTKCLSRPSRLLAPILLGLFTSAALVAQPVTLPPSGGNQKASVIQHIGLVEVRIDYSSPDVTGPNGADRRGQIWGQLVPYGMTNLGFGPRAEAPWRAGANENTVLTVSHDVEIDGKALAAGRYGVHMVPGEDEWEIIFSHDSTSWGSFFYDAARDALRVKATPEAAPYREWLTYDFVDRQQEEATVALHWEELRVPFTIRVPNNTELYLSAMRNELQSSPGFSWQAWNTAAQFCIQNNTNLEEALEWADAAISAPFVGQENFTTLQTKAQVLAALERNDESDAVMRTAVAHRTAGPLQIHGYARLLQTQGQMERAIEVYKINAEKHGNVWPINVGLARAYSAEGKFKKALEHAKLAYEEAPDPLNKGNLETVVELLEQGKDFNPTN